MLTISKMKILISSSLSPSFLLLPKSSPLALCSASQIPFLCHSHTSRIPNFALWTLQSASPMSPILAIPNRKLQAKATLSSSSCGEVHVILGPMFAGKTTTLLRRVEAERNNGRSVAVIKSNKDTRYGLDSIVTHDGVKLPCSAVGNLLAFKQKVGTHAYNQLNVIGIDEAQFFEDLYDFCREAADQDGKTVIVAGLDGDYLRRSFGSVLDIIPLANSVTKLIARCELCGKNAFFTLRKTDETQKELVGGADIYMPVCRQHYVDGQVVKEATRAIVESQKLRCESIP